MREWTSVFVCISVIVAILVDEWYSYSIEIEKERIAIRYKGAENDFIPWK